MIDEPRKRGSMSATLPSSEYQGAPWLRYSTILASQSASNRGPTTEEQARSASPATKSGCVSWFPLITQLILRLSILSSGNLDKPRLIDAALPTERFDRSNIYAKTSMTVIFIGLLRE